MKVLIGFRGFLLMLPLLAISSTLSSQALSFQKHFRLLPAPRKVEFRPGTGLAFGGLHAINMKGGLRRPVLSAPLSGLPLTSETGKGVLVLRVEEHLPVPSAEGYVLEISAAGVVVTGKSGAGVFYGCQTLQQLLEDARDQDVSIPACRITDYPDIPFRAVHLDIKYHLDNQEYYYRMMDRLAAIKVNAVILEFEDKLRYRSAPAVGAENAVSIDEFAALSNYAKERNIEISPLVQGLGHAAFILKHDEYVGLRDDRLKDWVFDPLDSGTYELQFRLYDEAIAATPHGRYLHVGGDEVYNLGKSARSQRSGMSTFELQLHWLNRVCAYARAHNRVPVFWDDMIFNLAGVYMSMHRDISADSLRNLWNIRQGRLEQYLDLFPRDCIYMRWHYTTPLLPGNLRAIEWMKSRHLKVMGASAVQEMSPMLPRNQSLFRPVKEFNRIAVEQRLEGMLATAWDDSSPHFETFWRGIYDYAAGSWYYRETTAEEAHSLYRHRFYGPGLSDTAFEFQDLLEQAADFWDTAFVRNGSRITVPAAINLVELPGVEQDAPAWRRLHKARVARAKRELANYVTIRNRLDECRRKTRRNHYALRLFRAMNDLQAYNAHFIVLLDEYAENSSAARAHKIRLHLETFPALRAAYEDVFSETRFLDRPPGYIMDDNYDTMLANSSHTSSDWMFLFELAMNHKAGQWLKNIQQ